MKALFVTALLAATVAGIGLASAADGCGPGCRTTVSGACVVDGWGSGARGWNECPAGAQPRPPCPSGYTWSPRKRACFASY
ncbi:GCG_CRPN prefix-to-repeats domain-containing protein [Bradyrhizobium sp. UFLA05-112]